MTSTRGARRARARAVGVVAVVGVLLSAVGAAATVRGKPAGPAPLGPVPSEWRALVMGLELSRLTALRALDPRGLDDVYVPGAAGRRHDVDTVRRLRSLRLHVVGLQAWVVEATLTSLTPSSATLRVVDALSAYDVVDAAGVVRSHVGPRPARAMRMTLRFDGGRWRIASLQR